MDYYQACISAKNLTIMKRIFMVFAVCLISSQLIAQKNAKLSPPPPPPQPPVAVIAPPPPPPPPELVKFTPPKIVKNKPVGPPRPPKPPQPPKEGF